VSDATVETVLGTPALPLRSIVGRYTGYRLLSAPGLHRGLPSSKLTFIISLDDPVDIATMPGGAQSPARYQAFVGGLHSTPASIRHEGFQYGISVSLTPLGARALFGLPAGELAWAVVPLEDLMGPGSGTLIDRLVDAAGWHERFAVLDQVLIDRVKEPAGPQREVSWAWKRLLATGGTVDVATLAEDVGYSRRHLTELFRRELGLAPKAAARVLRFERSVGLIRRSRGENLAAVASGAGYYDQAHMIRQWRGLAGCTPSRWVAEELPSVQDQPVEIGSD
jgi:AraC-like DNA-binding protein